MIIGEVLVLTISSLAACVVADPQAYAPQNAVCPQGPIVRYANDELCSSEANWIQSRDLATRGAITDWLANSGLEDFNPYEYLSTLSKPNSTSIRLAMAFSGGGFRSMLNGAGVIAAFDNRTAGANNPGGMGGLLQALSYVSGLSGGSWLVGSVSVNNWEPIPALQADKRIWNFQNSFNPSVQRRFFQNIQPDWAFSMVESVSKKNSAGFKLSFTDIWGRMLSAQMFTGQDSGAGIHFSDTINSPSMAQFSMPMPIILTDSVTGKNSMITNDGNITVTLNSTVYEITPFEFGSWDPSVSSFVETRYLGTALNNGYPQTNDCIVGLDNIGFLIGASSTLFNMIVKGLMQSAGPLQGLYSLIIRALGGSQYVETAPIWPNPFNNLDGVDDSIKYSDSLSLVDGGEDGQNIPFSPLIQPARDVDVIFAVDSSADTSTNWPNGSALWTSYQRQFVPQGNYTIFPEVPNPSDYLRDGLGSKPTFFQCSIDTFTSDTHPPPIIINLPNSQHTYPSNTSTFKLNYSNKERDEMIRNGYNIATQNWGSLDPEWRTCVACAVILREQQRRGDPPTEQCQQCFSRYCYEPTS